MFQETQKYLEILGIKSVQANQKRQFNTRSLLILLLCSFFIVSSILYLIYVPNSFDEYIESINISSTAIVNTIFLLVFLWKNPKLFEFLENLEIIVRMGMTIKIKFNLNFQFKLQTKLAVLHYENYMANICIRTIKRVFRVFMSIFSFPHLKSFSHTVHNTTTLDYSIFVFTRELQFS